MKYKLKFKALDADSISAVRLRDMENERKWRLRFLPTIIKDHLKKSGFEPAKPTGDLYPFLHPETATVIIVDLFNNTVAKTNNAKPDTINTGNYKAFTYEQLRFFDGLGFKISDSHQGYTKQTIGDWWNRR